MKKIFGFILAIAFVNGVFAQQDPQFSMAIQNKMAINPGYAGSTGFLCGNLLARQQWTGFEGRPRSLAFSADMPIMKESNTPGGIGLTVIADKAGLQKSTYAKAAYAYKMSVGDGNLGIGLELGILNVGYDINYVSKTGVKGFSAEDMNDARVPFQGMSKTGLDAGFGIHYSVPNKLYVGLSASHLPASKLVNGDVTYTSARHIYLIGGYEYTLPNNPNLVLKPSILFKTSLVAHQLDVNVIALMNNAFWGGLSYRVLGSDAIVPMIGYQTTMMEGKGTFKAGYSYDITLSKLNNYSSGSHEIMLGFCYDITPPVRVTKYKNVRFL